MHVCKMLQKSMLQLLNDNRAGELILFENMADSLHKKIREENP